MKLLSYLLLLALSFSSFAQIIPQEIFIEENLGPNAQENKISLTGEKQKFVKKILGHNYSNNRASYWISEEYPNETLWVLQKVGKMRPIDIGVLVKHSGSEKQRIQKLRVLAFRESRGWEIKLRSFTKQFNNAGLKKRNKLDKRIDGISGATLSFRVATKLARMALVLHPYVFRPDENENEIFNILD